MRRKRKDHSNDSAFDERGILRDGQVYRTKMMAMDHRSVGDRGPRLVHDGSGNTQFHRPGARMLDDAIGRQSILDARAEYLRNLQDSWKHLSGIADAGHTTDARRAKKMKYDPAGRLAGTEEEVEEDEDDGDEGEDEGGEAEQPHYHRRGDAASVQQMQDQHSLRMDAEYNRIENELSNAWRGDNQ
jgi:hypothetical protein